MCGILGWIRNDPIEDAEIGAFGQALNKLSHRGPDGKGVAQPTPHCLLGHTRLAIIDLTKDGAQPISNETGEVWAIVNGEIYNHRHLRETLQRLGHRFRSRCDSEVIVHAWEAWGPELTGKLSGIFSFAVYDVRRKRLFIARDHAGVKPIFYWESGNSFAFGSTIEAIKSLPQFSRELDNESFYAYLAHRFSPFDQTIYRDVRKLPAGHSLTKENDGAATICRYWKPQPLRLLDGLESYVHKLSIDLEATVRGQLMSDVPVGVLLSGGIDSSLIAAIAAQQLPQLLAFVCGFAQPSHDERPYARVSAKSSGARLIESVMDWPEMLSKIPDFLSWHDGPFFDYSSIAIHALCVKAKAEGCKALLAGDGADELFAGYLWYDDFAKQSFRTPREALSRYFGYNGFLSGDALDALSGRSGTYDPLDILSRLDDPSLPQVNRAQHLDFQTFLVDDVLAKVDGASMATGVEVRVPFLDQSFLREHFLLPPEIIYRNGERKSALKRAARAWLPSSILTRRKKGFGFPLESWSGSINQLARRAFCNRCISGERGLLVPSAVLDAVEKGDVHRTWLLLMAELWLRHEDDPAGLRDWLLEHGSRRVPPGANARSSWRDQVTIVIRACGESTTDLCTTLVAAEGFEPHAIKLVGSAPFPETLTQSLHAGLEANRKWTLCLDADVLPLTGRIHTLLQEADSLPPETFELQPVVFDRLFGSWRPAGVHLYRTSYLKRAIEILASLGRSMRPETRLIEVMAEHGYTWHQSALAFGLHDFLQKPEDIFRKAYVHAQKHAYFIPQLTAYWGGRKEEADFAAALEGLEAGVADPEPVPLDKEYPRFTQGFQRIQPPNGSSGQQRLTGAEVEALLDAETKQLRYLGYNAPPVWNWAQSQLRDPDEARQQVYSLVYRLLEQGKYNCRLIGPPTALLQLFEEVASSHALKLDRWGRDSDPLPEIGSNDESLFAKEVSWPESPTRCAKGVSAKDVRLTRAAAQTAGRIAAAKISSILIYGAGEGGKLLYECLQGEGVSIAAFLQSHPPNCEFAHGTPLLSLAQGLQQHPNLPIAVASISHSTQMIHSVVMSLRSHGIANRIFVLSERLI